MDTAIWNLSERYLKMIKHIVCFKLKDNSLSSCEKAKNVLMSMQGQVPEIMDIKVGIDLLKSPRSYDIVLEVLLKDKEALDRYQADDYHCQKVKTYMISVRTNSISVDYEF
ncbi:hypothetical protein SDC9_162451 [bioreactor metagenome]|uniref:Stress-response A/B barrel domain-containing protein n=1 Tax=bioreactor metagenome TaxID=1076179 RepID=A0A645FNH0_9ZZZZ